MRNGKKICEHLKLVRKQIADANGIPYEITECPHQGPCAGTCPKCESELRYIENQLTLRRTAGKAVSLVGLSLGISTAFAAQDVNNDTLTIKTDSMGTNIIDLTMGDVEEDPETTLFGCLVESYPEFPGGENAWRKFFKNPWHFSPQTDSQGQEMTYRFAGIEEQFPNFQFLLSPNDEEKEDTLLPLKVDDNIDRVRVSFIIEKDGSVSNVKILQTTAQELSDEVERVIKQMPQWKPGKLGKNVKVRATMTLSFSKQILPKLNIKLKLQ